MQQASWPSSRSGRTRSECTEIGDAVGVGAVDHRSARFWLRAVEPGAALVLELRGSDGSTREAAFTAHSRKDADATNSLLYPDDFAGHTLLRPVTRYHFRLRTGGGRQLGEGRFETAPATLAETPPRFCFAFTSCHQPFDRWGRVEAKTLGMLQTAHRALEEYDAKFLILTGDQVYADEPACYSLHGKDPEHSRLLGLPRDEVRRLFQRQYRRFWAAPGFLQLTSGRSALCTLDDHEIVDNWGSSPAHSSPEWQEVAAGALDAFFDYQGSRSFASSAARPARLYRWFSYGTIAVFVADVRSERRVAEGKGQVMSDAQIAALESFLRDSSTRHALFVVLGVPLAQVPGWLSDAGTRLLNGGSDLHDRWSNPAFCPQRDELLQLFRDHRRAHPRQHLCLLSGDIHTGWATTLDADGVPPIRQFVASALTNHASSVIGGMAQLFLTLTRPLEREIDGLSLKPMPSGPGGHNPYGGMNLGLVEVERRDATRSWVRFRLVGQDPARFGHPRVVFDSGPLSADPRTD